MGTGKSAHVDFAWSEDRIRDVGHGVVDVIARYVTSLATEPVFKPVSAERAEEWIAAPLPQAGESIDEIMDAFVRDVAPHPFGNGHPRFFGWVNSPPAVIGVMAEALAAAMNPSVAGGNHAAVWIERQVLEWFKKLVGFPPESMGLLVSGGSAAAIVALNVARWRACHRLGWDVRAKGMPPGEGVARRLLVYQGAEGHACNQKAVELLGIGSDNVRIVPSDGQLRIEASALDQMLARDRADGHVSIAVVASGGTVNTGAIDPLSDIADVCRKHDVWLHVDAAYGGPALMTRRYAGPLAALSRADSIALDPHKWMYVPVDAGLLLVRDAAAMRDAFSLVPPYLRTDGDLRGVQGPTWFSEYGPEQTRPFRALKVWACLRYFGVDGYRELLEHDLAMAQHLADRARAARDFVVWEPRSLSIVCFRACPPALADQPQAADALNRQVLEDVQLGGEGFLSGTTFHDRFWLRACIVNPLATVHDVDAVFDAVVTAYQRRAAS